jgi:hypothetical protein
MIGEYVDKSVLSFCFSNTTTIFFVCDECDKTSIVDSKKSKAITALPIDVGMNGFITADLTHAAVAKFQSNWTNRFHFHIQDKNGNNFTVNKSFL